MEYVFVKDSEGYVFKKATSDIMPDEKIISENEYLRKSGIAFYEKKFTHGGARENAGRKKNLVSLLLSKYGFQRKKKISLLMPASTT